MEEHTDDVHFETNGRTILFIVVILCHVDISLKSGCLQANYNLIHLLLRYDLQIIYNILPYKLAIMNYTFF